jgi:hypothetical protein
MDPLTFRFIPTSIPLGRTDTKLIVSNIGRYALESIRGHLLVPAAVSLLRSEWLEIPGISVGEEAAVPIPLEASQTGRFSIQLTGFNAKTAGGAVLDFGDRSMEFEVTEEVKLAPGDVSLVLEPAGDVVQNRISTVMCTLHNRSRFPITEADIRISAEFGDVYAGNGQRARKILGPGSSYQVESQVLSKAAGQLLFTAVSRFMIRNQSFSLKSTNAIKVLPSNYPGPDLRQKGTKRIVLIGGSQNQKGILQTDRELTILLLELKNSAPLRDKFQVEVFPALTLDELAREVTYDSPSILHFAGHATERGIFLETDNESKQEIPAYKLLAALETSVDPVECVVLNACNSLTPARELAQGIPYVIGMRSTVLDETAMIFSRCFYEAIGAGYPFEGAFQRGRNYLITALFDDRRIPVLFKDGVEI